jgi:3-oxoacyl-[acyl-carrier protein] reductase
VVEVDLKGKTVVLTGAGRGVGRALAIAIAGEGAQLVLASRTETQLQQVLDEVQSLGAKAIAVPTDLTEPEQVEKLAKDTLKAFGTVDVIINNAGWCPPLRLMKDTALEDWDMAVNANARGPFLLIRALLPTMLEKKSGTIINVSSNIARGGCETAVVYGASKAALIALGEGLLHEVAKDGIRVTTIIPGTMNTDQRWDQNTDFPRDTVMEPEDLAQAIVGILKLNDYVLIEEVPIRPLVQDD